MSNTLLGFGLFALVAAIVGGGLKAFGFEVGVLKSTGRQAVLAAVGLVLIGSAEWNLIQAFLFLPQFVTETAGPTTVDTGQVRTVPVSLTHSGQVDVTIQSLLPDWNSFTGQRGVPGQDGLLVSICPSKNTGACLSRQMGESQTFSQELPAGPGSVSVFNFATSPKMTFTLRIKHPS